MQQLAQYVHVDVQVFQERRSCSTTVLLQIVHSYNNKTLNFNFTNITIYSCHFTKLMLAKFFRNTVFTIIGKLLQLALSSYGIRHTLYALIL